MQKKFFTVSQIAKCCKISRATLLRLEEKGLIHPIFIEEKNGYRRYDNHNVTRILQIKHLLDIGLSYDEICEYFETNGTSMKLLSSLERRMNETKRMYEEMNVRIAHKESLTFETVTLPEYVCYAREYKDTSSKNKYDAMYSLFHEVVEKGLCPLPSGPLFNVDKNSGLFGEKEDAFIACIPLEPDFAPSNSLVFKSCRAFSCLYHGNYDTVINVKHIFAQKVRELKLCPTGYPRVLGIVAPYTAREFKPENYVSRIVIPIKED